MDHRLRKKIIMCELKDQKDWSERNIHIKCTIISKRKISQSNRGKAMGKNNRPKQKISFLSLFLRYEVGNSRVSVSTAALEIIFQQSPGIHCNRLYRETRPDEITRDVDREPRIECMSTVLFSRRCQTV